ncbi:MAG: SPOR domain-containing protein [Neisseriaceae bacterium]|nr:SPOR domain-containing protein [Neisseriaceae bacterium]
MAKKKKSNATVNFVLIGLIAIVGLIAFMIAKTGGQKTKFEPYQPQQKTEKSTQPKIEIRPAPVDQEVGKNVPDELETLIRNLPEEKTQATESNSTETAKTTPKTQLPADKTAKTETKPEKSSGENEDPVITLKKDTSKKATQGNKKLTPEEILNGKTTPKPPANDANTAKKATEKRLVVQTGAFLNRSQAEAQQAELALMNIKTHIETVKANGQTTYHVRSGSLKSSEVEKIQSQLRKRNIESIALTVQ